MNIPIMNMVLIKEETCLTKPIMERKSINQPRKKEKLNHHKNNNTHTKNMENNKGNEEIAGYDRRQEEQ